MISASTEEYLKTIYVIKKKNGIVRVTDIANVMKCSKPSVTKQLNILKNYELIDYESYGHIDITEKGIDYAKDIIADCDILYILLHDVIGIDYKISKEDATKIKGVISDESVKKIASYIYDVLDLKKMNCNFNIRRESCRACLSKKGKLV